MMNKDRIKKAYELAKEEYAELGVNTDAVLKKMKEVVISPALLANRRCGWF